MENIYEFYKGKRVFLTGHTGFKGSWMCKMLANAGAIVTGYSLEAPTESSLFKIANIEGDVYSVIGDIRDMAALKKAFDEAQPEIVLHLAAQPIVILLHSNHKVSIERLQYMLIRTSRIRIANNNILMFCSRTNTIRNDAVCGEVAATNHVTCTSSRDRDNWQSVLIGEKRALVGMGNKL